MIDSLFVTKQCSHHEFLREGAWLSHRSVAKPSASFDARLEGAYAPRAA
jgi:hypothetical protein